MARYKSGTWKKVTKRQNIDAYYRHKAAAEQYARGMGWQPNDWRYLATQAHARGYRDVELHRVGTWYERDDAGEIMRVLEPIRHIGTLKIIVPTNDSQRPRMEGTHRYVKSI